jgi:PPE-repeat protein
MEFTTLPPEVISALIHTGPGAESLASAAAAWQELSASLEDAAEGYAASLSALGDTWYGPSSMAMAQSAAPYVSWLRTTSQQAELTAVAAQSAAAAVNTVRATVVPTAAVVANRIRLWQLLATNIFGQNLPAIAETEAEYQAMWANNSAAMTRYQVSSAQASTLPQLTSPTSVANPTDLATQASAVPAASTGATSAATSTATSAATSAAGLDPISSILAALEQYFSFSNNSNAAIGPNANLWNTIFSSGFPINLLSYLAQNQSAQALAGVNSQVSAGLSEGEQALGGAAANLGGGAAGALGALGQAGGGLGALGAAGLGQVSTSAALGAAVPMGNLSVPPSAAPLMAARVELASAATPLGGAGIPGMPMLPPLMPPPISPGSGWRKRKAQKYEDIEIGAHLKGKVIKPPPSAG